MVYVPLLWSALVWAGCHIVRGLVGAVLEVLLAQPRDRKRADLVARTCAGLGYHAWLWSCALRMPGAGAEWEAGLLGYLVFGRGWTAASAVLLQAVAAPVPAATVRLFYLALEVGHVSEGALELLGAGEPTRPPMLLAVLAAALAYGLALPCAVAWYVAGSGLVQWARPAHVLAATLWSLTALVKSGAWEDPRST
jgi:hypothetical protein